MGTAQRLRINIDNAFFAGQFVSTWSFGAFFGLSISCLPALFRQIKQRKHLVLVMAYIVCVLAAETVFCANQEYEIHKSYLHGIKEDMYELITPNERPIIGTLCPFLVVALSDFFMAWRCWEVLGRSRRSLLYTGLISFAPFIAALGVYILGATIFDFLLPYYYGASAVHNILLSIAIAIVLLERRRDMAKEGGDHYAKQFLSWKDILTETGVAYTIFSVVVFTVQVVVDHDLATIIPFPLIEPIFRFPIVYRIAHGDELTREVLRPNTNPLNLKITALITFGHYEAVEADSMAGTDPFQSSEENKRS